VPKPVLLFAPMTDEPSSSSFLNQLTRGELPIILIAAVVQGWALYGLHWSVDNSAWPATSPGTLLAFYATAAFVPLTVQMLVQYVRRPIMWLLVAALAAFYLLVGWHYGEWIFDDAVRGLPDRWLEVAFIVFIQWLLVMPFLQTRLIEGRWRGRYALFFSTAWNNKLVLVEAVIFTGLFWLLLFLWGQLFRMLGIRFFTELFREPIFAYPVTSIVFGVALKLIGSLERLTKTVLDQILNVLKWLALLAGLILALFTVALAFELPSMIASGERAIGASWLLWLVAGTVLLVNAAYRDGSIDQPYPRAMGFALRCVVPLTVVVALVAVYAVWLRIDQYGFTVSRFWASVVAGAAVLYSVGYAIAVRHKQHWMRSIAGVNVLTALYLIAALTLALTPVLSPYRISADSQFALAQAAQQSSTDVESYYDSTDSPMTYLRFAAGKYGRNRLEELSRIQDHPRAEEIRREATATLARENRWGPLRYDRSTLLASIALPAGQTLEAEPELVALITEDTLRMSGSRNAGGKIPAVFVDLDHDQIDELVLLQNFRAVVYSKKGGAWRGIGNMAAGRGSASEIVISRLLEGDFNVAPAEWDDLVIGGVRYRVLPNEP
jgi:hypothetical protein